jgi:hypothetical protein
MPSNVDFTGLVRQCETCAKCKPGPGKDEAPIKKKEKKKNIGNSSVDIWDLFL